ncbi:MAG: AMP-binding protein, partial [Myxococcales bacterium]|nr:AMP-binding protein [Myxococcales bacterium]
GHVKALCVSEKQLDEREGLRAALEASGVAVYPFAELYELPSEEDEKRRQALLPTRVQSDSLASLLFTSGTTGQPKGVMLTQKNFTFMVSELKHVFDVSPRDGMLSVLPLHHTLEFAAGMLMPFSGGAQVTYLDELSSDSISSALKQGKTTAIVGVPALWELLYRRIKSNLADGPAWLDGLLNSMIRLNSWIQQKSPIDLGRLLFLVVHNRFGGRIRYLISGGSALGDHVKKLFHGLGMPIFEGYGLTESAPVLTVTRPDSGLLLGSVGRPLPHVDVQILDADEQGVGEVIARGNNVMSGYFENDGATADAVREGWLHTGDLGYMDEDKNLYIVGRRKEVIVDQAGKNIYPDELEELYGDHALVKELSVVGLPDGSAEQVAALVVPDYEADSELSRSDVQQRVHDHLRAVSADLPFFKRIKILHLWDRELPRTATRKIRRREVVKELERLERLVRNARDAKSTPSERSKEDWLIEIVASVCGKPKGSISMSTRLPELGFDSLMYTELAVAVDAAGGELKHGEDLTAAGDMRELAAMVERVPKGAALVRATDDHDGHEEREEGVTLPESITWLGQRVLDAGRRLAYHGLLETEITGRSHVPYHTNFIVAPNHCSHADIGLVKEALGDAGKNLCALAATDYFFDSKAKRTFFENFTKVVPMDRAGSLRKSLRRAHDLLLQGYSLLIFPEGTRSPDGQLRDFKASIGYLAL